MPGRSIFVRGMCFLGFSKAAISVPSPQVMPFPCWCLCKNPTAWLVSHSDRPWRYGPVFRLLPFSSVALRTYLYKNLLPFQHHSFLNQSFIITTRKIPFQKPDVLCSSPRTHWCMAKCWRWFKHTCSPFFSSSFEVHVMLSHKSLSHLYSSCVFWDRVSLCC